MYLVNIISITLYAIFFRLIEEKFIEKNSVFNAKLYFCIATSLNWILLSSLRHESVGPDTSDYKKIFELSAITSWDELKYKFIEVYFGNEKGKDIGYSVLEKIFQYVSTDYQNFLTFIALLFTSSLCYFIYKYSSNSYISWIITSTLFTFYFTTGHRQTIATAIASIISYQFIKERKALHFFAAILIASTIHKSILIITPLYFIYANNIKRKHLVYIIAIYPILFAFKAEVSEFIKSISGYEEYGVYEGAGTYKFTAMMMLIGYVLYARYKKLNTANLDVAFSIKTYFIALLLIPLTYINPSAMRVVYYFSIYLIILIPSILSSFKGSTNVLAVYASAVTLIILFINAGAGGNYIFYWD